jgi:hypothetical protein
MHFAIRVGNSHAVRLSSSARFFMGAAGSNWPTVHLVYPLSFVNLALHPTSQTKSNGVRAGDSKSYVSLTIQN